MNVSASTTTRGTANGKDGETDALWSFHSLARRTVTSNARSNARDDS